VPSEDLPIGIVTFLFTDIEGHTRILERLGEIPGHVQFGRFGWARPVVE
jgi:hypothetical protein